MFAFPLRAGRRRIGVLTLYQDLVGELSVEQAADSLVVADVVAEMLLIMQAQAGSEVLATELGDHSAHRAEVHQAAGLLAVQLSIPVTRALVRLRAYAYAADRTLADVASDVVGRRLQLGDDRETDGGS